MHTVIDGDQLVYACGFATEGEPLSHTLQTVKTSLNNILIDTKADSYTLYIDGRTHNFREDIAVSAPYKGNRVARKPDTYDEIRDYMGSQWDAVLVGVGEADDHASIDLYKDWLAGGIYKDRAEVIVSSPDKDLNNTPGWHYNPRTREQYYVTLTQANRHLAFQMLMGDPVDNIPGLPYLDPSLHEKWGIRKAAGCGKATASAVIKGVEGEQEAFRRVIEAYEVLGLDKDYFEEQASLLWMSRSHEDLNCENKNAGNYIKAVAAKSKSMEAKNGD